MKRWLLKLRLATICLLLVTTSASAQPDEDVAHWLDRDVTLLVNIDDVSSTYQQIKSLELFSNPRFVKAIQMLSDERFPIVKQEQYDQILNRLYELEALIRKIDQISIAVHDLDEKVFEWSLFVRAESDVLQQIQDEIRGIDDHLEAVESSPQDDRREPGSIEAEHLNDNPDTERIRWGQIQRAKQWLVLSTDSEFLKALPDRIDNTKFRSLGKSRKYRAIQKRKSRLMDHDGLITVYGNPVRMRFLIPHTTQNEWDLLEIDELPSCGLNIAFVDSDDEEQLQPIVLADAVVKFTKPAVGQGKIFEHYRAIEIPPLAVEPIELQAFARDESAVAKESMRVYDQQHGPQAADLFWSSQFQRLGIDHWTDAIPRRNAFIEMRFVDKDHSFDRPGLVSMEKLNDAQAAQLYAEKIVGHANDHHKNMLGKQEDGPDTWWTIPQEKFNKNSGLRGFDRKRHVRNDFHNCWHDAYVITDQWWVQGDMPVVKDQVGLLTEQGGEDHSLAIKDLVDDLSKRLGNDDPPVMLKYFATDSWQENLNNLEQQYANSNLVPGNFRISIVPGKGNTFRLESSGGVNGPNGAITLFFERGNQDKTKGSDESSTIQRANLNDITIMMATPLTKRNEDGHRIALKKREDLKIAIQVMILKSISETFPRQLFLYTRNDQHIRIMMGVYPSEREPEKTD